jgi:hypothetical protein
MHKRDILLNITPTSLVDPGLPRVEFGALYLFEDYFGIQLHFGGKIDVYNIDDEYYADGYSFSVEYKFFTKKRAYFSIENGITSNKYTDQMTYYLSETDNTEIEDIYTVFEETMYIGPKFGLIFISSTHFVIDGFAGIGLQKKVRTVEELEFNESLGHIDANELFYEWGFGPSFRVKNEIEAKLFLGLNINYRF